MMTLKAKRLWVWLGSLLVSLCIHFLLSMQVLNEVIQPLAVDGPAEVEFLVNFDEPVQEEEAERLLFEDPVIYSEQSVLLPTTTAVVPPPLVELAMRAAAGGSSNTGFTVPLNFTSTPTTGSGVAGFGGGVGFGVTDSTNQFALYVQGLKESGLDVVFVVDTTGSMGWVLSEVSNRIDDIVDSIRLLVPTTRFGIVAYRDLNEPEYVTRLRPLTFSLNKLQRFVNELTAEGGGNLQEAVFEGVHVAVNYSGWRQGAKKVVIVIGDAPPHKSTMSRLLSTSRSFAKNGGQISTLDVGMDANPTLVEAGLGRPVNRAFYSGKSMLDFQLLAESGGGIAATLDGDVEITKHLVSLIMGGQFSREMALLLEGV